MEYAQCFKTIQVIMKLLSINTILIRFCTSDIYVGITFQLFTSCDLKLNQQ